MRFEVTQQGRTGVVSDNADCFPFKGASDIVITLDANEETICKESTIELKLQVDPQKFTDPPNLGKLLSALHISLTKAVLEMVVKKNLIEHFKKQEVLSCKGLYLSKDFGGIKAEMTIPIMPVVKASSDDIAVAAVAKNYCTGLSKEILYTHLRSLSQE